MAIAPHDGKCRQCGGIITMGTQYRSLNRPVVGTWYHMVCPRSSETTPDAPSAPVAPVVGASSGDALATLAGALAPYLPQPDAPEVAIDEATIRRIVAEAVKAACITPSIIEVKRPDLPTITIEGAHYLMARLIRLVAAGIHVYLWGPAGTGKTTALMQAAQALGREFEVDTLDVSTSRTMVQGYKSLSDNSPSHTAFTRCWTGGKFYIADECDNAPGNVQTLFNSALANGHAPLGWASVERAEGFGFGAAGNTPGKPTAMFPDRRPMSAAFADRLYFMHWPIDPAIECRAAGLPVPPVPYRKERTCTAQDWGQWVQNVRAWAASNAATLMVTPRATLTGLQALAVGETPEEVAHGLVFRGADASLVAKALSAVPLP